MHRPELHRPRFAVLILAAACAALARPAALGRAGEAPSADGTAPARCGCGVGPNGFQQALAASRAVLVAVAEHVARDSTASAGESREVVRFRVERAWKWPDTTADPPRTLVVGTPMPSGGCRTGNVVGARWLVVAHGGPDGTGLFVSGCTGTLMLDAPPDAPPADEATQRWMRRQRAALDTVRTLFGDGVVPRP